MSFSASAEKNRAYPFFTLGFAHSSKLSARNMNPISSQSSSCSREGMLWALRMASQPMSFRIRNCRRNAATFTAAPNGPRSWCRHTPLNFRTRPFN